MNVNLKPVLVIGGGISGITAAIELAETGKEVVIIEKLPYLGGNVALMNNYFPKLCPPSCGLEINFKRIRNNSRIHIYTETIIKKLSGSPGDFTVVLQKAPQYIKDNCTACGKCAEVCPVTRPNAFNFGFDDTKAAYLPHDMAFPMKFVIDGDYCKKEDCNQCLSECSYNAIDLKASFKEIILNVAYIIGATGWKSYNADLIKELKYTESRDIITNLEFERLLSPSGPGKGKVLRPSDNKRIKDVIFVQCAGSRDEKHLPYCSAVCCPASLKHALSLRELVPNSHATIFYIDLRVSGRNEDFLKKVEKDQGIELIKGKVAEIKTDTENGDLIVEAEDILAGRKKQYHADLVVLATGIVPEEVPINISRNSDGFALREQEPGIIFVSCARTPMDVSSSVKDATAAALKAIQIN